MPHIVIYTIRYKEYGDQIMRQIIWAVANWNYTSKIVKLQ